MTHRIGGFFPAGCDLGLISAILASRDIFCAAGLARDLDQLLKFVQRYVGEIQKAMLGAVPSGGSGRRWRYFQIMGNSKPGKLIFSVSLAVLLGCAGAYWASGFDVGMLRLQSSDQQPKAMPHVIYPSSHR